MHREIKNWGITHRIEVVNPPGTICQMGLPATGEFRYQAGIVTKKELGASLDLLLTGLLMLERFPTLKENLFWDLPSWEMRSTVADKVSRGST